MIPPVETRSIRPCYSISGDCIFLDTEFWTCRAGEPALLIRNESEKHAADYPCMFNLIHEELQELILLTGGNLMIPLELLKKTLKFMLKETSPALVLQAVADTIPVEDLVAEAHFWSDDQATFEGEL